MSISLSPAFLLTPIPRLLGLRTGLMLRRVTVPLVGLGMGLGLIELFRKVCVEGEKHCLPAVLVGEGEDDSGNEGGIMLRGSENLDLLCDDRRVLMLASRCKSSQDWLIWKADWTSLSPSVSLLTMSILSSCLICITLEDVPFEFVGLGLPVM